MSSLSLQPEPGPTNAATLPQLERDICVKHKIPQTLSPCREEKHKIEPPLLVPFTFFFSAEYVNTVGMVRTCFTAERASSAVWRRQGSRRGRLTESVSHGDGCKPDPCEVPFTAALNAPLLFCPSNPPSPDGSWAAPAAQAREPAPIG